jgi:ATP/maltotriose-dependent transcriptional regulator MalT
LPFTIGWESILLFRKIGRDGAVIDHIIEESSAALARELHLSEATLKSHLIHIFEKLGVTDRTSAVTVAIEKGILRLQSP